MKDFISFEEHKKKLLADRQVRKDFDALSPEYQLIQSMIERRLQKNMSQEALAHKVGTKQSAISRIESGNANPSVGFLKKIAQALDVRLDIRFQ